MAKYEIKHTCGHTSVQHIDGKSADQERKAEWFRARPCLECLRAEEIAEAKAGADAKGLPSLVGSPKQIAWAETIRGNKMQELDEELARNGALSDAGKTAVAKLHGIADAKWWIDNRGMLAMSMLASAYKMI